MIACDSGIRKAPPAPWMMRAKTSIASELAAPHATEATRKTGDRPHEDALAAEAQAQPARRGNGERGGDDIRGDDPADLVLRRRERALHVRQRHGGDGPVYRIQEARQPDRGGDQCGML